MTNQHLEVVCVNRRSMIQIKNGIVRITDEGRGYLEPSR
jgi:hypothetical protein